VVPKSSREVQTSLYSTPGYNTSSLLDSFFLFLHLGLSFLIHGDTSKLLALLESKYALRVTDIGYIEHTRSDKGDTGRAPGYQGDFLSVLSLKPQLLLRLRVWLLVLRKLVSSELTLDDFVHVHTGVVQCSLEISLRVSLLLSEDFHEVVRAELCHLVTTVAVEYCENGYARVDVNLMNSSIFLGRAPPLHVSASEHKAIVLSRELSLGSFRYFKIAHTLN
jgi:hypothetical protein